MNETFQTTRSAWLILALLCLLVFTLQPDNNCFLGRHHGWVSSHSLAFIERSTSATGYVGYTQHFQQKDGSDYYWYFNRCPIWFAAAARLIIDWGNPSLADRIFRARQIMNAVYGATLLIMMVLARALGLSVWQALGAVCLTSCGYHLLWYKDMINVDQPALLGNLLLIWTLARYYRGGGLGSVYAGAFLAAMLSQGGSFLGVLFAWFLADFAAQFNRSSLTTWGRILKSPAIKPGLTATVFYSLALAYNALWESAINKSQFLQTSIIQSALLRIGEKSLPEYLEYLSWPAFLHRQLYTFVQSLLPYPSLQALPAHNSLLLPAVVLGCLSIFSIISYRFLRQSSGAARTLGIILLLSAPAWIFPMRHFTGLHEFTAIYYTTLALVVQAAVAAICFSSSQRAYALAGVIIFIISHLLLSAEVRSISDSCLVETADFQQIATKLPEQAPYATIGNYREIILGAPHALSYYLGGHPISRKETERFLVGRQRQIPGYRLLTPENNGIFLLELAPPTSK